VSRIPGTFRNRGRTLLVLPSIPDDAPAELKNAIAIRNACSVEGRCSACGVSGVASADPTHAMVFHYTFEHEPSCPALTDEAA
jgi:hypothetical protein